MEISVNCAYDKLVPIAKLIPNPRNPNTHPKKQIEILKELMRYQGWRAPITVSNRSGFIVRGHGRLMAAQLLRLKKAPVDYQDYETEAQEWEDLVADNRIAELAHLDAEMTAAIFKDLADLESNLEMTGFTDREVRKIIEKSLEEAEEQPEVAFSEELMESSNFLVFYYDNDIDWLQATTFFGLKTVKALDSKQGFEKQGIGRVLNGAEALNRLMK